MSNNDGYKLSEMKYDGGGHDIYLKVKAGNDISIETKTHDISDNTEYGRLVSQETSNKTITAMLPDECLEWKEDDFIEITKAEDNAEVISGRLTGRPQEIPLPISFEVTTDMYATGGYASSGWGGR